MNFFCINWFAGRMPFVTPHPTSSLKTLKELKTLTQSITGVTLSRFIIGQRRVVSLPAVQRQYLFVPCCRRSG